MRPIFLLILVSISLSGCDVLTSWEAEKALIAAEDLAADRFTCVSVIEQMPELIGGLQALQAQVQYPATAAPLEGRVFVQFTVTETGAVEAIQVARGLGPAFDAEARRVVQLAQFKPAMQRGQPVAVRMSLPLTFTQP